jgi:hypothetical protein
MLCLPASASFSRLPALPAAPSSSPMPPPHMLAHLTCPLPSLPPATAVDDGEPRSMNDPANLPFMEAIMRGQMPAELDPGDPNIQVGGRAGAPGRG